MVKSLHIFRCDSPLTKTLRSYASFFGPHLYLVEQIQSCHCSD